MNDWKIIIPERKYKAGKCRYKYGQPQIWK